MLRNSLPPYVLLHCRRHKLPISHRIGPDPASIDAAMIGERILMCRYLVSLHVVNAKSTPALFVCDYR
jgi:hypothetical protein